MSLASQASIHINLLLHISFSVAGIACYSSCALTGTVCKTSHWRGLCAVSVFTQRFARQTMLTSLNASVNRLLAARRVSECKFRAIRPATSSVDGGIENYLSFQLLLALETRVRGDVVTVGEPALSALCERFTGADDCAVTRQALRVSLDESGASQKMLTEKEIRKRVQLMKERMINWRDEKFKKFWLRRCVDVWKAPELRIDFLAAQAAQAAMADAGDEEGAKVRLCMT